VIKKGKILKTINPHHAFVAVCFRLLKVITFSSVAEGKWGHAPRREGLGGASTHFIQTFKNAFFSRNLGQNILKNAYFLEKSCKIAERQGLRPKKSPLIFSGWGLRPQTPALLLSLIDINLSN